LLIGAGDIPAKFRRRQAKLRLGQVVRRRADLEEQAVVADLARGFNLRKVKQLDYFWDLMDKTPAPQLSEPGHSLTQPIHLIALRYPILTDGKLEGVVSMMIRTGAFLEASGLDKCKAWKIICLGEKAESDGKLSDNPREVKLSLPSTEWVIQYDL